MVVYNVTFSIDPQVEHEWLSWMRSKHIPKVMSTGHFRDSKLCRVHGEEEGGVTYAITYVSISEEDLNEYKKTHAPRLQEELLKKYQGRFAAFQTVLTVVEEF